MAARPQPSDQAPNRGSPTGVRPASASAARAPSARSCAAAYPGSPVMCAIRVRPQASRCSTAIRLYVDAVGDDGQIRRIVRRGVRVDDGDGQLAAQRRARVGPAADHDETVDPAAQQRAHMVLLADRVAAGVAQEHRDLARPEGVLGAHEDRDAEPALQVTGEQTDGPRPPDEQPAGELVRPEGQPLGGLDHPLPGLGAHLAAAVQGLGRGRDGHAGPAGRRR